MMQTKPVKKFAVVLAVMLVLALGSLLAQVFQTNHNYERSLAHIRYLQDHLREMDGQLLERDVEQLANEKRVERLDMLEYQNATFRKKFPDFARIVEVAYGKARQYGFSPNLVLSVIHVESAFNPQAVSAAGAFGLMQVRYSVWKDELGIDRSRIFDIGYNIDLGLRILKQYCTLSGGDMHRALFLYNNGYKYNNGAYLARVQSSIYNQDAGAGPALANVSR